MSGIIVKFSLNDPTCPTLYPSARLLRQFAKCSEAVEHRIIEAIEDFWQRVATGRIPNSAVYHLLEKTFFIRTEHAELVVTLHQPNILYIDYVRVVDWPGCYFHECYRNTVGREACIEFAKESGILPEQKDGIESYIQELYLTPEHFWLHQLSRDDFIIRKPAPGELRVQVQFLGDNHVVVHDVALCSAL